MNKKNGKLRLSNLTNKFYESEKGNKREDDKVKLSNLSDEEPIDFQERQELERVELLLVNTLELEEQGEAKDHDTFKTMDIEPAPQPIDPQTKVINLAINLNTSISRPHLFEILVSILNVKDATRFFETLSEEAKNFFMDSEVVQMFMKRRSRLNCS
jgi:hypothetical protein